MRLTTLVIVAVVILACTEPLVGQRILSDVDVGAHVGFDGSDARIERERLGFRLTTRLRALPIGIQGAYSWYVPEQLSRGGEIGGRQYWVTAIVYPASHWWYLGAGVTNFGLTSNVPPESRIFILEDPSTGTMTQTGVVYAIGSLSLFGELQILNTFTPDRGLAALFFSGLSFSLR